MLRCLIFIDRWISNLWYVSSHIARFFVASHSIHQRVDGVISGVSPHFVLSSYWLHPLHSQVSIRIHMVLWALVLRSVCQSLAPLGERNLHSGEREMEGEERGERWGKGEVRADRSQLGWIGWIQHPDRAIRSPFYIRLLRYRMHSLVRLLILSRCCECADALFLGVSFWPALPSSVLLWRLHVLSRRISSRQ